MKCLIEVYINFTSEFDRGRGHCRTINKRFIHLHNTEDI